jgi:hypothetical protein
LDREIGSQSNEQNRECNNDAPDVTRRCERSPNSASEATFFVRGQTSRIQRHIRRVGKRLDHASPFMKLVLSWSKSEALLNFDRSSRDTPLSTAEQVQRGGAVFIGIAFRLSPEDCIYRSTP